MIWRGTKQEHLNCKHKTIKFEYHISHINISFSDTVIYKGQKQRFSDDFQQKIHSLAILSTSTFRPSKVT